MESGSQLGHYEILFALAKGGMGEVWRARDTKLSREVAIKTLPVEFSKDADGLARFERKAKLLASLNHLGHGGVYVTGAGQWDALDARRFPRSEGDINSLMFSPVGQ